MEGKDYVFIQDQIGYTFHNTDLLQQAFVRRSYSREYGGEDNEVLEFIGDKVLDFIVVKLLTEKYGFFISDYEDFDPDEEYDEFTCTKNENELTKLKQRLVQKKTLAERIDILDLADYLIMGKGDIQNNIERENSVKEDLFEAIIGAVALDSDWNMEAMQDVVQLMLDPDSYLQKDTEDNYVALIQEWTLKEYGTVPCYHFEASHSISLSRFNLADFNSPQLTAHKLSGVRTNITQLTAHKLSGVGTNITQLGAEKFIDNSSHTEYISPPFDGNPHTCSLKLGDLNLIFRNYGKSKIEARKAVCELAYKTLMQRNLLLSIRDEIQNPNKNNAINQLETLARRGYFSIPSYDFKQNYASNGNPVWKCTCYIEEIEYYFYANSSSKKDAKKQAAYSMLEYVLETY